MYTHIYTAFCADGLWEVVAAVEAAALRAPAAADSS